MIRSQCPRAGGRATGRPAARVRGKARKAAWPRVAAVPAAALRSTYSLRYTSSAGCGTELGAGRVGLHQASWRPHIQTHNDMLLTEMTSPDIDALPRDIVVVYPVASCEQRTSVLGLPAGCCTLPP